MTADAVGDIAFEQGIRLHELTMVRASLEEAFMELTAGSVEYHAGVPGTASTSRKRSLSDGHHDNAPDTRLRSLPPATGRAGLRRRDRLGVHQDPLGPLHLLDAARRCSSSASASARRSRRGTAANFHHNPWPTRPGSTPPRPR